MKPFIALLVICLKLSTVFGQTDSSLFLHPNTVYYRATDLSKMDALDNWFYVLLDKNLSYEDSVRPIGQLTIQRNKMIGRRSLNFTFQVFAIKDSSYCFRKSQSVRTLSRCVPPEVAGDIIIYNQFVFLNTNICLQCKNPEDGLDYCRPIINKVFSAVDRTKASTLEEIVKQFPIKGRIMKVPF